MSALNDAIFIFVGRRHLPSEQMPGFLFLLAASLLTGRLVPVGAELNVRLTTTVGSYASKPGSPVHAVLIAPVLVRGETMLPAGSTLLGTVTSVRRVGLGIIHETAALGLEFTSLTLPGGETLPIRTRLLGVDNSRERVTRDGRIQGPRTTSSVCYRVSGYIRTMLLWYVHAEVAEWMVKSLIVNVPEPEIYYPAGVELTLTLTEALNPPAHIESEPVAGLSAEERGELDGLAARLPVRSYAAASDRPSDLINLLFAGSRDELAAAFSAAGWVEAQPASLRSGLKDVAAVVESHGYLYAPMSSLLVNDAGADMSWEKSLNDFAKRHHVRLWKRPERWHGRDLWIGAATQDIELAYLRRGEPITHKVDEHIDPERDKIVNDLVFTNCVEQRDWLDRPGAPQVARNGTGDRMTTDGRLAVIVFNRCEAPRPFVPAMDAAPVPAHGGKLQRIARRQILSARSDLLRDNPYWRSYEGGRWLVTAARHRKSPNCGAGLHHHAETQAPAKNLGGSL